MSRWAGSTLRETLEGSSFFAALLRTSLARQCGVCVYATTRGRSLWIGHPVFRFLCFLWTCGGAVQSSALLHWAHDEFVHSLSLAPDLVLCDHGAAADEEGLKDNVASPLAANQSLHRHIEAIRRRGAALWTRVEMDTPLRRELAGCCDQRRPDAVPSWHMSQCNCCRRCTRCPSWASKQSITRLRIACARAVILRLSSSRASSVANSASFRASFCVNLRRNPFRITSSWSNASFSSKCMRSPEPP